jgi:hypothetical protein
LIACSQRLLSYFVEALWLLAPKESCQCLNTDYWADDTFGDQ